MIDKYSVCVYIYIEREREREIHAYVYSWICMLSRRPPGHAAGAGLDVVVNGRLGILCICIYA